jgi:hypothetical protein
MCAMSPKGAKAFGVSLLWRFIVMCNCNHFANVYETMLKYSSHSYSLGQARIHLAKLVFMWLDLNLWFKQKQQKILIFFNAKL